MAAVCDLIDGVTRCYPGYTQNHMLWRPVNSIWDTFSITDFRKAWNVTRCYLG